MSAPPRFADGPAPTLPAALRQLAGRVRRLSQWRGTPEGFCIERDDIALALARIARAVETGDLATSAGNGG